MLEYKLGRERFNKVIKSYLVQYRYANASTEDFLAVTESVSGMDLDCFFEQWLERHVGVTIDYKWKSHEDGIDLLFLQQTKDVYKIEFEVVFKYSDGRSMLNRVSLGERQEKLWFENTGTVSEVLIGSDSIIYGQFQKFDDQKR